MLIKELLLLSEGTVFDDLQNLVDEKDKIIFIDENIALDSNLSPGHQ